MVISGNDKKTFVSWLPHFPDAQIQAAQTGGGGGNWQSGGILKEYTITLFYLLFFWGGGGGQNEILPWAPQNAGRPAQIWCFSASARHNKKKSKTGVI